MFFIFLIFLAAISIEAIGTFVSVLGLAETFAGDPIILTMAVCLDFAKLIVVSLLYKYWQRLGIIMRTFLLPMAFVMMTITSYGVAGYMSSSFQKALAPNTEVQVKIDAYQRERTKLEARKTEMDKQISQLPEKYVRARQKLMTSFEPELKPINARIVELDKAILDMELTAVDKDAHLGPVAFIAKTFDVTPMTAVSIIIMLIVFVFDPLAVLLVISGNMLLADREKAKANQPQAPPVEDVTPPVIDEPEVEPEQVTDPVIEEPEPIVLEAEPIVLEEPEIEPEFDELLDENRLAEEPPVVYPDLDEPENLIESDAELVEIAREHDIPDDILDDIPVENDQADAVEPEVVEQEAEIEYVTVPSSLDVVTPGRHFASPDVVIEPNLSKSLAAYQK